jgi:LysR family transcriptional activator of nhaA
MTWLNYHHLLYFWKVAKEGSIARASVDLRLAPPTISVQIHQLEEVLGQKLFERHGRGLLLTDVGRVAFRYAESIFATGDALLQAVGADTARRRVHVNVGVADTLPRIVVARLLQPMFAMAPEVAVTVTRERSRDGLLGDLAAGAIEVVLSDAPVPQSSGLRAFNLPLGECGTAFLAAPGLAQALSGTFPRCLNDAPCVFPGTTAALRRELEDWCEASAVLPRIVADMDDVALALEVAATGVGVIAVADIAAADLSRQHDLVCIGSATDLRQTFFAWSLEQEPHQAAVVAMLEGARERLGAGANATV